MIYVVGLILRVILSAGIADMIFSRQDSDVAQQLSWLGRCLDYYVLFMAGTQSV